MTIRIDTLRNQLAGTRKLLELVGQELDDLHLLAYERHSGSDDPRVKGGSRDYSLDNHGHLGARDAYRALGLATTDVCGRLEHAINGAIKILTEGNPVTPTGRVVKLVELGDAIAAQARRTKEGEYTAVRRQPQPDMNRAMNEVVIERDALNRKLTAATKEVARLTAEKEIRTRRSA